MAAADVRQEGVTRRFYQLDFLRFIAAFSVVVYHYTFFNRVNGDVPIDFPEVSWAGKYGYLGVNLFFVISGFVILMSAEEKRAGEFLASRVGRLYPAFWTACSMTALCLLLWDPQGMTLYRYLGNMAMMSKWLHLEDVDGVYWTLFVEMRFYAMVFLMLLFSGKLNPVWLCALWLALSIINFFHAVPGIEHPLILMWSPYFVAGCMFYLIAVGRRSRGAYLVLLVSVAMCHLYEVHHMHVLTSFYKVSFDPSVLVVLEIVCFSYLALVSHFPSFLVGRWMRSVGALTYPLYLVHAVMGVMLINYLTRFLDRWTAVGLTACAFILLAALIHRFVERPFGPLLRHWTQSTITQSLAVFEWKRA
jgi:peptidoglycan/LPS O-acetylase OafA/YrhL